MQTTTDRVPNRLITEISSYLLNTPMTQWIDSPGVMKLLKKLREKTNQYSCRLGTPDVGAVTCLSLVPCKLNTATYKKLKLLKSMA